MHTNRHRYKNTYINTPLYNCIRIYAKYMHIYTYIYICIYIYVCVCVCVCVYA